MSVVLSNIIPILKVSNMAYKKGEDRRLWTFFLDCIDDYVGKDAPVRLMDTFINHLDMEELGFLRSAPAGTGAPGNDSRDLMKLYVSIQPLFSHGP